MPSDFAIRPLSLSPPPAPPAAHNPKLSAPAEPPVGPALAAMVPQIPSVALDTEKGVVVVDFRNDAGTVINSIPSAEQLAAYGVGTPKLPPAPASAHASHGPAARSSQAAPSSPPGARHAGGAPRR